MVKKNLFLKIFFISFIIIILQNNSLSKSNNINQEITKINSKSYVVIDRKTNLVLVGKNENEKRKMASTTKIMTGILIIENCNLNQTIEVSKKAASIKGSKLGLKSKDKITIKDLLYGLLLKSGNDCAIALSEHLSGSVDKFCEKMNQKASKIRIKKHKL